jgi:hypothetical protein
MTNPNSSTSSIPKTRKPRQKKWSSEIARQQHSNARRSLAREAATREAERIVRGKQDLDRAAYRQSRQEVNKRSNMIANGLTPRLTAVMNSWGLTLPVSILPSQSVSGMTDFKTIRVTHDYRLTNRLNRSTGTAIDPSEVLVTVEELRQIAAETRGVFYHEVGHNLFTVPLQDLLNIAHEAGYSFHSQQATIRQVGEAWNRWDIDGGFHKAWNVLEDQRMEMLLVEESPAIASMLTVLVIRNMLAGAGAETSWALVAGRYYLPSEARDASRKLWDKGFKSDSRVSSSTVKAVVDRYMAADTAWSMIECVEEMRVILENLTVSNLDNHNEIGNGRVASNSPKDAADNAEKIKQSGQRVQQIAEKQDEEADNGEAAGQSGEGEQGNDESDSAGGNENDAQGDSQESSTGQSSSSVQSPAPGSGSSTGSGDRDEDDQHDAFDIDAHRARRSAIEDLAGAMDEALENLANNETINDDVVAMNEAYNCDEGSLPKFGGSFTNNNEEDRSKALSMVGDIERAFDIATADCAPHWESQQRRGVLEPIRYRTRQPGDMEVFRSWSDNGEPGTDISVSLFVDISGSMKYAGSALGSMAWAVKTACERINIDCDVTAFDHGAYSVWGTNESPHEIPFFDARGGTCPKDAFTAMLWEERPKKHHIVMVMTDGEWSDMSAFMPFKHSNIHSMLFFYDGSGETVMTPSPRWARRTSMNEAYEIGDLAQIPAALESMLIGLI